MSRARVAAALALTAVAVPAAAFVRATAEGTGIPLAWPVPVVAYVVNDSHAGASPSCAASPDGDPALDAVRAGFSAWQQSCSDLKLVYAGTSDEIRVLSSALGGSGDNVVIFRAGYCSANPQATADPCWNDPDVSCNGIYNCFEDHSSLDRTIVALTTSTYDAMTGRIIDADIEVNGWNGTDVNTSISLPPPDGWYFTCDTQLGRNPCLKYGDSGCNSIDLQNTLTHEAGNFIGIRHPCNADGGNEMELPYCSSNPAAYGETTMYPVTTVGDIKKRTLSDDDISGVCSIYPKHEDGGCGCGSGSGAGALALLLAAVALRPRLRAITQR